MHKLVLNLPETANLDIHHKNNYRLDNTRENLVPLSRATHVTTRGLQSNNTSGYKGVSYNVERGKFRAQLTHNKKKKHIGYFDTPHEAALAYDKQAKQTFGLHAKLNFN